ncbi:MAG: alpha/beta hydrolase [Firmicutes bacterium]|jgi:pimeloyl-ACP methyl ester carboxylesterase|uniref:AB hydrolase-1 domain-containing protein n=1 Tax=Sulfobacillus benefaciens TaxID=453960 RepID=A0A2T2X935_9FIRM|nr:alpha/beta hydrolase [Bacillota bacterium]PSR30967.1 MAG: hypothetical protein C7B43_03695 [Sulfobacillus benefaciens]
MENGWISVEGGELYFEEQGQGRPVVLLHAGVADRRQWDPQFDWLARSFRVIRYDVRGYGNSQPSKHPFDLTQDLFQVMDHRDIETAILVGSSMGGSTAIHAAVTAPERIQRLVLAGSGLFGFQPSRELPEPPQYRAMEAAMATRNIDRIVALTDAIWLSGLTKGADDIPEGVRALFRTMNRTHWLKTDPAISYLEPNDVPHLDQIMQPVLLFTGTCDTPYTLMVAEVLASRLPRVSRVDVPGAVHLPNVTHPDLFRQRLGKWISV